MASWDDQPPVRKRGTGEFVGLSEASDPPLAARAAPDTEGGAEDVLRAQTGLYTWLDRYARWFVLTGAGCSTASGIPDYRDGDGAWKRKQPVLLQTFVQDPAARARYWARSLIGWRSFAAARPNDAHRALARFEAAGRVTQLVTQNVDGLHQAAGSSAVIDLHGRLDRVICLGCGAAHDRAAWQSSLAQANPAWTALAATLAPDGDADLEGHDFGRFHVPACADCGGVVKPDVVFFGEAVPAVRVSAALHALAQADAMLVVGSSLMVYSGYRFARAAAERGLPVVAVNLGRTRADALLAAKFELPCAQALSLIS